MTEKQIMTMINATKHVRTATNASKKAKIQTGQHFVQVNQNFKFWLQEAGLDLEVLC